VTTDAERESREKLAANLIAAGSLVVTIVFGAMTYQLSRRSVELDAANARLAANNSELTKSKLDLETRLAALAEARTAPFMDVQYIVVRDRDGMRSFAKSHKYLLQRNSITGDGNGGLLVVLKITNAGGTRADDVLLAVDEIKAQDAPDVEVLSPSDFHQRWSRPVRSVKRALRLGAIAQGDTRLVPVFRMRQVDPEMVGAVLEGLAYIPRSIQYTDPVSHEHHESSVREMLECPFDMVGDCEVRG